MRIGAPLAQFVWKYDLGELYITDVGFQLTWNPDTVLGPDISFISKARLEEMGEIEGYWPGPPDLAVEVLSPGYPPGRANKRKSLWLSFGTRQVWIVDLRHSTITIYRSPSDVTTFSGSDVLEAQDLFPGFRLSLDKIFGPTPGM
jgi:Uma2 family endonuclease